MKTIDRSILCIIFFLVILAITGCAGFGTYGRLKPVPGRGVTIDTLVQNWSDYKIFYKGYHFEQPSGVLFDVKGDSKNLVGEGWTSVGNQEALLSLVSWAKLNLDYYPRLWTCIGPDKEFYGYLYTGSDEAYLRLTGDKTLQVLGLPDWLRRRDYGERGLMHGFAGF
ncbi:MAG: hypothetical protein ACOWYE_04615 [Desulfatiglandales bacterium]